MDKLLVICGPTATGKTNLALMLAKIFKGEIISADSRQVYKYMDIGTGKDIPNDFSIRISKFKYNNEFVTYYTNGTVRIWGYDLANPKENFSISEYKNIIEPIVNDIFRRRKLPMVVGGSGLYIKSIVDNMDTIDIPPDSQLRKELENKNLAEIYQTLYRLNPRLAGSLNNSDRNNVRRLIRKIEIEKVGSRLKPEINNRYDVLFIGLNAEKKLLNEKIKTRVKNRINSGFENEVRKLRAMGMNPTFQSMHTPGYKQFVADLDLPTATKEWFRAETTYAKRQLTWFRKDKRITWYNLEDLLLNHKLVNKVSKWYKGS